MSTVNATEVTTDCSRHITKSLPYTPSTRACYFPALVSDNLQSLAQSPFKFPWGIIKNKHEM
jgi:hypothetical protein